MICEILCYLWENIICCLRVIRSLTAGCVAGREEGREQRNIEIAKKMLSAGMDIDIIINMTDLSKDEIEKLTIQQ